MSKKKINNRLEKLFDDIDKEQEAEQVEGQIKIRAKSSKKTISGIEAAPINDSAEPFANIDPLLSEKSKLGPIPLTPSTMLSTAFRTDDKSWSTLRVIDELEERSWGAEEQLLVRQVADQLSLALENARLFQESQRRAREMTALAEVGREISATLDLKIVLERIAVQAMDILSAPTGAVFVPDSDFKTLSAVIALGSDADEIKKDTLNIGEGMLGNLARKKYGEIFNDATDDPNVVIIKGTENIPDEHLMAAPIWSQDSLSGLLVVWRVGPNQQFIDTELEFLESLAQQAAIAVENARLFEESEERAEELAVLNEMARELSTEMNISSISETVYRHVTRLIDTRNFFIALFDESTDQISFPVFIENSERADLPSRKPGKGLTEYVIQSKEALFMPNNINMHAKKLGLEEILGGYKEIALCWLGVPLLVGNKSIGAMAVQSLDTPDLYDERDKILMTAVASQVAIAVENARLFGETKRRSEELASLNEIISAASQTFDTKVILETVLNKVLEITAFDGGLITMFNDTRKKLERAIRIGLPGESPDDPAEGLDGSLCNHVYKTGKELVIQDIGSGAPKGVNVQGDVEAGLHGYIGIPIGSKGRTLGTLCIFRYKNELIPKNIIELTSTIGGQLGFTIENTRLFDESRKFRLGLERSADAVFLTDLEGTIVYANPGFEKIYGYPIEEAIGQNPRIIKSGLIPQEQYKLFWDTLLNKETVAGEIVNKTKDGRIIPIDGTNSPILDESGNILGFLAIHSDITKRKEDQEALQRRNEYLAASAEIGRLVTSTLDLDAIFSRTVNLIVERFGFYHASIFIIEESGFNAVLKEATGAAGKKLKKRQHFLPVGSNSTVGKATGDEEVVVINNTALDPRHRPNPLLPETKAETAIPLHVGKRIIGALDIQSTEINAFSDDDVAILQLLADQVAVGIDNARSYNIAQLAVEEMREVDRLKSQFLANMSHELRTPLNSIIGFARVILKGIDGPTTELQQQDLTAIFNSGQHLLGLINDILDLSRIEAGKMDLTFDQVNINDLISSVMSTAAGLVRDKSIKLRSDIAEDLPMVRADAMRLRQVLINFMSNASKFTEEGEIVVKATLEELTKGQPAVMISVIDSGPGIAHEDQEKLFQPFSQVDASLTRKVGGSGLGLSICHHLIQMHNGQIGVHSAPGKGSTFYFTIPIVQNIVQVEGLGKEKVILAIDDDPHIISLYERYLQPKGYRVIGLNSPAKAKERAQELNPFAITLDIMMPGYDGWQVLTDLKSSPETQGIPVIICSIVEDENKAFSLGAADYLVKPVQEEEILNSLDRLNADGSIREVLVIDDDPNDLRLLGKMLTEQGRYKAILAEGGPAGWNAIEMSTPHAVILDLFMPELDGFTILENLRNDEKLRHLPVIVLTGEDLTDEQQRQLGTLGKRLLQKSTLNEQDLIQTIENALQRVKAL